MKVLVVFDFDHTVVDDNTDTYVMQLGENGAIPPRIKSLYEKGHWTAFMNKVMLYLHENKVSKMDLERKLKEMALTHNMLDLFQFIEEKKFDRIIISDSNAWFIDVIMKKYGISETVGSVFTNGAHFDPNGVLKVDPYHNHEHESCPVNLCKGKVMEEYLSEQKRAKHMTYDAICYVGDGGNDFCPAERLKENDVLFAREDYALHKKLKNSDGHLKCRVVYWKNGLEIISALNNLIAQGFA